MNVFTVLAMVVTLTALLRYVNSRLLHLPPNSALMIMSLAVSVVLTLLARFSPWGDQIQNAARTWMDELKFSRLLLDVMLSFLLFAGGLRVDLGRLFEHWKPVVLLALAGTTASTMIVGGATWLLLKILASGLPLISALLFGALIAPTDPVAVLHVFRDTRAPGNLRTTIAGESLFNDGISIVLITIFLGVQRAGGHKGAALAGEVLLLFAREAVGGIALGLVLGFATYLLMRRLDEYVVEILLTLALTMGGYSLAKVLGSSGPLTMVAAGIVVGNLGRARAMSEETRRNLYTFWELVDEFLNALLFVLIGLEAIVLHFQLGYLLLGGLLIPVVLGSRALTSGMPTVLLRRVYEFPRGTGIVVTWGGLKGGISVALALSLSSALGSNYSEVVVITYVVVAFSIIAQGLTIERVLRATGIVGREND